MTFISRFFNKIDEPPVPSPILPQPLQNSTPATAAPVLEQQPQPSVVETPPAALEDTEEQTQVKKQQAFEKLMTQFNVSLVFIKSLATTLNRGELTKELMRNIVVNSKGSNQYQPQEVEAQAENHYSELDQMYQLMLYFKNHDLNFDNFDLRALFCMIAAKTWEGTPKIQQCADTLKQKVLHAPKETIRRDNSRIPNLFIDKFNFRLFFDNVNYTEFSEKERQSVFKTLGLTLLIDPNFAEYLINEKKEDPNVVLARTSKAVYELVDRFSHSDLPFGVNLHTNSTLDEDKNDARSLSAFCGRVSTINPGLSTKLANALSQEPFQFGLIFSKQLEIVIAALELARAANDSSLVGHAIYSYRIKLYDQTTFERVTPILLANPHLLKAIYWADLLKICDKFSAQAVRNALLLQIQLEGSSPVWGVLRDTHVKKKDLDRLEKLIPRSDWAIWNSIHEPKIIKTYL